MTIYDNPKHLPHLPWWVYVLALIGLWLAYG